MYQFKNDYLQIHVAERQTSELWKEVVFKHIRTWKPNEDFVQININKYNNVMMAKISSKYYILLSVAVHVTKIWAFSLDIERSSELLRQVYRAIVLMEI